MLTESCNMISVHYKDRVWEIDLNSYSTMVPCDISSLAFELQVALNLSRLPVGLSLRVAPGEDPVVCPLSVLIVCPSQISTTFQGMSWTPLFQGGGPDDPPPPATAVYQHPCHGPPIAPDPDPDPDPDLGQLAINMIDGGIQLRPGSPLKLVVPDQIFPLWGTLGSTVSPSEGCGRPLTAPPSDQHCGVSPSRPSRGEGLGRPISATPSDKSFGMGRFRPGRTECFKRPVSAQPSDHSGSSGSHAWGFRSPSGFGCEENHSTRVRNGYVFEEESDIDRHRPATAPSPPVSTPR